MSETELSELKRTVESQHGGTATYVQSVPIHEGHKGQTVWDGRVAVFDLADQPKATRAYAWSYERPDGKQRTLAVLHAPPVASPRDAVRAAIVAEMRAKRVANLGFLGWPGSRAGRGHSSRAAAGSGFCSREDRGHRQTAGLRCFPASQPVR